LFLLTGFAFIATESFYIARQDFHQVILLLNGFAPLFGFLTIPFLLAFLYSLLLSTVERILTTDNQDSIPETPGKHKWRIVRNYWVFISTVYLSLKEHSPPLFFIPLK